MTMSTMFKLRPPFFVDNIPTTAPTIPMGITSQFIHPSRGMNAIRPRTSVTRPIMIETMFMPAQMVADRACDKSALVTRDLNASDAIETGVKHLLRITAVAAIPLALVACARQGDNQQELADLDRELTGAASGNQHDPALAAALRDQIMIDPALAQSSNVNAVRPPSRPDSGAVPADGGVARNDGVDQAALTPAPAPKDCPGCAKARGALTLGELAARQSNASIATCAPRLRYSAQWAGRLPADVPLYPDARLAEAAGAEDCPLRVVSFATAAPVGKVVDWYYTKLRGVGYSADHQADAQQHVLGGTRGDAAVIVYVSPRPSGGSDVDLVSNAGR